MPVLTQIAHNSWAYGRVFLRGLLKPDGHPDPNGVRGLYLSLGLLPDDTDMHVLPYKGNEEDSTDGEIVEEDEDEDKDEDVDESGAGPGPSVPPMKRRKGGTGKGGKGKGKGSKGCKGGKSEKGRSRR